MSYLLPKESAGAHLVGRVWREDLAGPSLVTLREGVVFDITTREAPTMSALLDLDDPVAHVTAVPGTALGPVAALEEPSAALRLLAPCDLQAIKAAGVTFARSMIERVIEERAAGDPRLAEGIRTRIAAAIGDNLQGIVPGSEKAMQAKDVLIAEGLWSQYLEVGIGPDAEVFTKCQPLSTVGGQAAIGLHPGSVWNNPEPEIVLAVDSQGRIKGATLGNDVNLRDFEGRSALLLSKAKDNNASGAIGPFLRLFDGAFGLDEVRRATLNLTVEGPDGFRLQDVSAMSEISRDPEDLVAQTIGRHHQYPDGFMLYLGTLFAPTEDRDVAGEGFTHRIGDVVTISEAHLGALRNTVALSTDCPPWTFGARALMENLARRDLL